MLTCRAAEAEEALTNQEWPQPGKLNVRLTIKHHLWLDDVAQSQSNVCNAFYLSKQMLNGAQQNNESRKNVGSVRTWRMWMLSTYFLRVDGQKHDKKAQ